MAKLISVIETHDRRGDGLSDDTPLRLVRQFWTPEGELLVDDDDWLRLHLAECSRRAYEAIDALQRELKAPEPRKEILEKCAWTASQYLQGHKP